jgi:hypothetical protein
MTQRPLPIMHAIPAILTCVLLVPLWAVAAKGLDDGAAPERLDLSLPPDAPQATMGKAPPAKGTALPELGGRSTSGAGSAQRGKWPRADLPYGAGYEARHGSGGQGRGGGRGR